jgi:G:T-mismatch repair DNA endonuclease (very short patch repair protein)
MKAAIVSMLTNAKEQELHEVLRSAEIPDAIREEWAVETIRRAIKRGRKKAVPLAWLGWADKWES